MKFFHSALLSAAAALALCATPVLAQAGTVSAGQQNIPFRAHLSQDYYVAVTAPQAHGTLIGNLNTKTDIFSYKITYTGLTSGITEIGFRKIHDEDDSYPYDQDDYVQLEGPVIWTVNANRVSEAKADGSHHFDPLEVQDIMTGKFFVTIYTQKNPGGEISGKILEGKF